MTTGQIMTFNNHMMYTAVNHRRQGKSYLSPCTTWSTVLVLALSKHMIILKCVLSHLNSILILKTKLPISCFYIDKEYKSTQITWKLGVQIKSWNAWWELGLARLEFDFFLIQWRYFLGGCISDTETERDRHSAIFI